VKNHGLEECITEAHLCHNLNIMAQSNDKSMAVWEADVERFFK